MNRYLMLCLLALAGCSTVVTGTLNENEGGSLVLDISLSPGFLAYWKDLRSADPAIPASPLAEKELGQSLKTLQGLKSWSLEQPKTGAYRLKISLDRLQRFSESLSAGYGPLVNWTAEGNRRRLGFTWSQQTLQSLIKSTGLADASSLEVFLAGGEGELTRDEYIELLSYFLETYDPRAKATVAASSLEVKLDFPRDPVSVTGGTQTGRTVKFKVPLVDVLLAARPLKWEVVY